VAFAPLATNGVVHEPSNVVKEDVALISNLVFTVVPSGSVDRAVKLGVSEDVYKRDEYEAAGETCGAVGADV
jgi:hypothetical protein